MGIQGLISYVLWALYGKKTLLMLEVTPSYHRSCDIHLQCVSLHLHGGLRCHVSLAVRSLVSCKGNEVCFPSTRGIVLRASAQFKCQRVVSVLIYHAGAGRKGERGCTMHSNTYRDELDVMRPYKHFDPLLSHKSLQRMP